MFKKKYHTIGTIADSNRKIDTLTHTTAYFYGLVHMHFNKNYGVKLPSKKNCSAGFNIVLRCV